MSRLAQTLPRIPSAVELYKYCKAEHRAGMLSRGAFRVGTLHDYRRTDIYGELVSDEQEGKKVIGGNISQLSAETAHLYPGLEALRQAGLINIDFSSGTRIENLSIESAVSESPNLLIFSTSAKYSAKIHEHWREAEGYDACYKITSARLFFRAVSRALGIGYRFLGFGPVVYEDRFDLTDSRSHIHPAMVKRKRDYFGQAEVRAAWATNSAEPTEPILMANSSAGLYAMSYRTLPLIAA